MPSDTNCYMSPLSWVQNQCTIKATMKEIYTLQSYKLMYINLIGTYLESA